MNEKTPAEKRAEKLAAAMVKLGTRHALHPAQSVKRRQEERASYKPHSDVRATFDRVAPGWNRPDEPTLNVVGYLPPRKARP